MRSGIKLIIATAIFGLAKLDCPEGTCWEGTTCCELDGGDFGCCPYENATCCDDKEHCCPGGYDCDLSQGKCERRGDNKLFFLTDPKLAELKSKVEKKTVYSKLLNLFNDASKVATDIKELLQ